MNPTRKSERIGIAWLRNERSCSQLCARCEKAFFLRIVILHVGTWSRCTKKTSKNRRPLPRLNAGRVKRKPRKSARETLIKFSLSTARSDKVSPDELPHQAE